MVRETLLAKDRFEWRDVGLGVEVHHVVSGVEYVLFGCVEVEGNRLLEDIWL